MALLMTTHSEEHTSVTDIDHEFQSKRTYNQLLINIQKSVMDTMQLKPQSPSSQKPNTFSFVSTKHIAKLDLHSPYQCQWGPHRTEHSCQIPRRISRQKPRNIQGSMLKEKTHIKTMANDHQNKINMKISHSGCSHNFTAYALHISSGLCKCNTLQHTRKTLHKYQTIQNIYAPR